MNNNIVEAINSEKFNELSKEIGCKTSLQITALRWFVYCIINDYRDEYIIYDYRKEYRESTSYLKGREIDKLVDEVERLSDEFENKMCSLVCDYSYEELGSTLQKSLGYEGNLRYRVDKYLSEYKVEED
jgi:hypothetical protein